MRAASASARAAKAVTAIEAAAADLRAALMDGGDTSSARKRLVEAERKLAALRAEEAAELAGVEQREQAEVEKSARALADGSLAKLNAGLAALEPRPAPESRQ